MHVSRAERHAVTGIEIVPNAAAQPESEDEILSLRVKIAIGALRVNASGAGARFKVGRSSPIALDKITPEPQIESAIYFFRPSRNRGQRYGGGKIGVATQNPWTA